MTVKTVKTTRKNALMTVAVFFLVLAGLILVRWSCEKRTYDMRDGAGRERYLSSLGWQVSESECDSVEIKLPEQFGAVLSSYNEMQKTAGFDLERYAGKKVMQYTYPAQNAEAGETYVVLYARGRRLIGGDIHSASLDGFMLPLSAREDAE